MHNLRRVGLTAVAAIIAVAAGHAAALAVTPSAFPCGRVTAYTAPTATTPGSITLGMGRLELAPGSAPNRDIATGSDLCLDGTRDASGRFTQVAVAPMAQGTCGVVTAYTPASGATGGSLTLTAGDFSYKLPVASGTTLTGEQTTGDQCFGIGVNGQGNAEVVRYSGPRQGAPAATAAPAAAASRLPTTAAAPAQAPAAAPETALMSPALTFGVLALLAAIATSLIVVRARRRV